MVAKNEKRTKAIRIGFYTGSLSLRSTRSEAISSAFEELYIKCSVSPKNEHYVEFGERQLKIQFIDKSVEGDFYFGYMSRKRRSAHLSYISDEDWIEEKIPLVGSKLLSERTYFIYYPKADLLILTLNHLGPKHSDLAYILFSSDPASSPIAFEAIWKQESIKELLETGSALRTCEISIAIPRNFNESNYDLSGSFAKQIIMMANGTSSSHMTLLLRGKSPLKKNLKGWLTTDVKESIKELLEKFPGGSGGLQVEKADVIAQGDRRKRSLVDQVLTIKKTVIIQPDGYTMDTDILTAMVQAKIDNARYLAQYALPAINT